MRPTPLSQEFARLLDEQSGAENRTLNQIIERTEGRGIFLVMILLCLPFAPLFSIPGSSSLLGFALAVLGVRCARRQALLLPRCIGNRPLKPRTRRAMLSGGVKVLRLLEKGVRPRRTRWMSWPAVHVWNSVLIVWMAVLLALPLAIPFTNTAPAYAIMLLAASMMEGDGVLIWVGYASVAGTMAYFVVWAEVIAKHFHQWIHTLAQWVSSGI